MIRRLPLLVVLATVLLPSAAHAATPRIKGGDNIDISQAPYTAFIQNAATNTRCTGVIIDKTTIWTAAHCVVDETTSKRATAADMSVTVGVSDGADTSGGQQKLPVASLRAMPRFPTDKADDVAVLTLGSALSFNGDVQPIAVADSEAAGGSTVTIIGYGIADQDTPNTKLRRLNETVQQPQNCASNALFMCSSTPNGTVCSGDSGGPVVTPGATPKLLAITSRTDLSCPAGAIAYFAKVTAPELRLYLGGNDTPPLAPRKTTTDGGYRVIEVVGQTMTCDPGTIDGSPSYSAQFVDANSGQVLQSGPSLSYTFQPSDAGRQITCVIAAANAGGTLRLAPTPTNPIAALRPVTLTLTLGTKTFTASSTSDAPTLTLTTTDAAGKVVRQLTFARGTTPARTKLPAGAYKSCVTTPQTVYYAAGSACVPEIVGGSASLLVRRLKAQRKGSRYVVTLGATGPAVGRKVTVKWRITRKGAKTRYTVKRVTLKSAGKLTSPSVPRRRMLSLQVILPALKGADTVPYSASRPVLKIATRR